MEVARSRNRVTTSRSPCHVLAWQFNHTCRTYFYGFCLKVTTLFQAVLFHEYNVWLAIRPTVRNPVDKRGEISPLGDLRHVLEASGLILSDSLPRNFANSLLLATGFMGELQQFRPLGTSKSKMAFVVSPYQNIQLDIQSTLCHVKSICTLSGKTNKIIFSHFPEKTLCDYRVRTDRWRLSIETLMIQLYPSSAPNELPSGDEKYFNIHVHNPWNWFVHLSIHLHLQAQPRLLPGD